MEISEFAFKLLLLFFPGLVCAYVLDRLTTHRPRELPFFLLQSFVLGVASYFTYWIALTVIKWFIPCLHFPDVVFMRALVDSTVKLSFREICFVTFVAFSIGCFISVLAKYKIPNRLAQGLGITKKFGELDVWGYTLNIPEIVWVTLRDHKHNLIYDGWIQAFSDDSKDAELLLRDVSVYKNDTGEKLYQVGAIYLSRNRDDISIECRTFAIDEAVKWKDEDYERRKPDAATTEAPPRNEADGPK